MKFGETLYRRSVPQWSAYNVKYDELKHLIKIKTSSGNAIPVSIPSAGVSRWQDLENELFRVITSEYENVALFLRSKQGEIERRLSHLEKQVRSAKRAVERGALDQPVAQARRYHKLVKDAESIGDEIEKLSRFANVQKTAFRKILKKYRKWTGSTSLQHRLEVEVFSSGALQVDYADYFNRLSAQSHVISSELAGPMLASHETPRRGSMAKTSTAPNRSRSQSLNKAVTEGLLQLDASLASVPYCEAAGSAYYWIHPDNLEEVEALLLRHMKVVDSNNSAKQMLSWEQERESKSRKNHVVFFDNLHRFSQDQTNLKPSRAALTARWNSEGSALITLSSLAQNSTDSETLVVKRKDLPSILQRSSTVGAQDSAASKIHNYLLEHRDVKPLATLHSSRIRFAGNNNSNELGTWATLDSTIRISPVDESKLGASEPPQDVGEPFPHSILFIRWEFTRIPEIVRTLDASHIAERIESFSTEEAAVYTIHKEMGRPPWWDHLGEDIRKVSNIKRHRNSTGSTRLRTGGLPSMPESAGPSSTDAPSDSVFSVGPDHSSATSAADSPDMSQVEQSSPEDIKPGDHFHRKESKGKKRARVVAPKSPPRPSQRYWNEFDDGDSDTNVEEAYAIYIDPNEPSFPGADTVAKAFGAMYDSFSRGKTRILSWFPMRPQANGSASGERTPLLFGNSRQNSFEDDLESSGSDSDEYLTKSQKQQELYRPHQRLTRRQRAHEATLLQFYSGLLTVSYIMLIMSAILLSSGRKKKVLEVDAGVVTGVIAAEACACVSVMLMCMRRQRLSILHYGLVTVNVCIIVVLGAAELTLMFAGR